MSNTPPPRRRRIAGERRRPSVAPSPDAAAEAPPRAPAPPSAPAPSAPASSARTSTVAPAGPGASPQQARARAGVRERLRRARPQARVGAVRAEKPPADSATGRRSWWGTRQSIVALAVALAIMLTLVVLGALGLLGNTGVQEVQEAEDAQVAAETAPSVAERAAEAILAYDHKNLDVNKDGAQQFMTNSFAEEYATTFDKTVKPAARTYRAQVSVDVQGSSVVRASADRVKVLLFVDQTTQSTAHDQPQVALNRVEFDMVQRDGEWLVDGISSY